MITVRFASGFSVQYNTATFAQPSNDGIFTRLYTKKDGDLVAYVPMRECIVEWTQPFRTYSAVRDETTETIRALVQSEFKTIQRQIRNLKKVK